LTWQFTLTGLLIGSIVGLSAMVAGGLIRFLNAEQGAAA